MSFGFIILRHIRNESQNDLWIESYTCIRKHYPETLIMVIDDNSNYEYIDNKGIYLKILFLFSRNILLEVSYYPIIIYTNILFLIKQFLFTILPLFNPI